MKPEGQNLIPKRIRPYFRRFHLVGSIVGFILFIRYGLTVGIEFGYTGGTTLAAGLLPDDIAYSVLQSIVDTAGMILGTFLGICCSLSFFLIIGAIAGDIVGRFVKVFFFRDTVVDEV